MLPIRAKGSLLVKQNADHALLSQALRSRRPRVSQDMLHPMQKRNREYAASLKCKTLAEC